MPRTIELAKQNKLPEAELKAAAEGKMNLPAAEKLELLVYLSAHPAMGGVARNALTNFPDSDVYTACGDAATPVTVLNYFLLPKNRKPGLVKVLAHNPSVPEGTLVVLADTAQRDLLEELIPIPRTRTSIPLLKCLAVNPNVEDAELEEIRQWLEALGEQMPHPDSVFDHTTELWMLEHAAEIEAEEGTAFSLTTAGDQTPEEKAADEAPERLSTLQKINKMTVSERIKTAMVGNKEERMILVRDGCRVVNSAVIASPKLTDAEAETIAGMKNVTENVLREMARNRKFIKQGGVVRNLVNNPRCPLDISMNFVKNLLPHELKGLSTNKNVPETLRKVALRMVKEKNEKK